MYRPAPAPGAVVLPTNLNSPALESACEPAARVHLCGIRRTAVGLDGPPRQSERPPLGRPTDRRDRQTAHGIPESHLPRAEVPTVRSFVESCCGVLCLVIAVVAASGVAAPLFAQDGGERADAARGDAECSVVLRSCNPATTRWAVPEPSPSLDRGTSVLLRADRAGQQDVLLPAYDDMGNPISRAEIMARMHGAGGAGVLGGVLGAVVGGGLGAVMACGICPCDFVWGSPCSPREEAFRVVAFLSGLVWGAALGAVAGSEIGGVNRWEALEQIRAERRETPTRGSQ